MQRIEQKRTGRTYQVLDDIRDDLPPSVLKGARPATVLAYKEMQQDEAMLAAAEKRGLDPKMVKA